MIMTVLPVSKNGSGKLGCRDNYRPFFAGFVLLLLSCFLSVAVSAQTQPVFKVVTNFAGCGGFVTHVFIDVDTKGNQVAGAGFSINFDPTKLTNPVVTLGADAQAAGFTNLGTPPSSASLNFNNVAAGQIGIILDGPPLPTTAGDKRVLVIRFDVAAGAAPGLTPISFGGTPTVRSVTDPQGNLYQPFTSQDGNVMIGGTACNTASDVSIEGRVLTPDGSGLRSAQVILTDSKGVRRSVNTSSLGYYQLDDVRSGETYIIEVTSRRFRFSSRTLTVSDSLTNVDFVGME
jgi:hypothetical protein